MEKKELAELIDAYCDAKASGNKYLVKMMIARLEQALDTLFPEQSDFPQPPVISSEG